MQYFQTQQKPHWLWILNHMASELSVTTKPHVVEAWHNADEALLVFKVIESNANKKQMQRMGSVPILYVAISDTM